ncbi:phage baseplate plug family protein [Salmonella enterica]|uniref:Cyanophage baseplate Pam3 plug gp18 domain-containing protein n=2 Tax=Salmonella enterica TaxID=28901 RepID=A0A379QKE4_SALER|nr:hypothetical protein [Salmonella enterica]ECC1479297.1 hypothetical protein [Salmonella enterica subsp. salamae]ECC1656482.1 hypothetical protein [Salmonella enterica subsp. salamae]ECD9413310.1 hypothetical protein [Salmonella enterica subsp. salamae]ECF5932495.1 hypothetical protein [Salmonella enterica subsp. salamae]EDV5904254.1 hypothetical protein [Salmonella enterica subsp. salamae]
MIVIPLNSEPNQSLTITLDSVEHSLTIKEAGGSMVMTIVRDGKTIISNTRLLSGTLIVPYTYLEAGNFIFLTDDEEMPYYTKFDRQVLLYVSAAELEQYR